MRGENGLAIVEKDILSARDAMSPNTIPVSRPALPACLFFLNGIRETRSVCSLQTSLYGYCCFGLGRGIATQSHRHGQPATKSRGQPLVELIQARLRWYTVGGTAAAVAGG